MALEVSAKAVKIVTENHATLKPSRLDLRFLSRQVNFKRKIISTKNAGQIVTKRLTIADLKSYKATSPEALSCKACFDKRANSKRK